MASDHRQSESALNELLEHPIGFDFFAALRLLESSARDLPRIGRALRAADENVRLVQRPRMDFVPSTITSIKKRPATQKWEVDCQFFGLFGPQGALPIELTEYAMARIRDHRDETFNRFIDGFYHRMMSFYYRAVASVEPTIQYDRPAEDRFAVYLGSLAGIGFEEFRDRDRMPDLAKRQYAGHLAQQNHHADGLVQIISGVFQIPVTLNQFVGCWLRIPETDQLRLGVDRGRRVGVLGHSAPLGSEVWETQQCIRIHLGPLNFRDYQEFLPHSDNIQMLRDMVCNYAGITLAWVARVTLRGDEVPDLQLGETSRLGWTSWLKGDDFEQDASDLEISSEQLAGVFSGG